MTQTTGGPSGRPLLLLVDGTNIIMRAAFGGQKPTEVAAPMAVRMIERAAADLGATHMVIALDLPGTKASPSWRRALFPAYKAGRTTDTVPYVLAAEGEFAAQGWCVDGCPGYEADDTIATRAARARRGCDVMILSSDHDLAQLTAPAETGPAGELLGSVVLVRPQSSDARQHMDAAAVCAEYEIARPSLLPDLTAITGERGDNIPGVPTLGPKRAVALLAAFGDLEGVIRAGREHLHAHASIVATCAEQARISKKLATLATDAPVRPLSLNSDARILQTAAAVASR